MKWNQKRFETIRDNVLFFTIYILCVVTIMYLLKLMACYPYIPK
jgi:hypothetical protein